MMTTFGVKHGARVAVIIDGAHLYNVTRNMNFDVDFKKLRSLLYDEYDCRRITYLMRVLYDDRGEIQHGPVARMLDFVRFNGYNIVLKEGREWTDNSGRRIVSKSVDVQVTVAMFQAIKHVDEIIVFAGSEELVAPFEECSSRGARITLVSSLNTSPVMVSTDLRSTADWFIDIAEIKDKILRRDREVPPPLAPSNVNSAAVIVEDRREGSFGSRMRVHPRSGQLAGT